MYTYMHRHRQRTMRDGAVADVWPAYGRRQRRVLPSFTKIADEDHNDHDDADDAGKFSDLGAVRACVRECVQSTARANSCTRKSARLRLRVVRNARAHSLVHSQ